MTKRSLLLLLMLAVFRVPGVTAQDFGVMESAETIQRGNFKLVGYPMFVFGEDGADDELGIVVRGGYGFTDRFDAEIGAAFYDDVTFLGINGELWLVRAVPGTSGLNLAARGGFHLAQNDGEDATGISLAALLSSRVTPRAEILGALDYSQTFRDEPLEDFSMLHLVPGVEYALSRNLDFLAELGVGLNDDSANYLSVGVAFYLR